MELLMLTCAQFHGKWKVWNNKSKCYTGRNTPRTCTSQCSGTWRTWEVFLPCQHSPLVSTNTPCQHKFLICPLGFVAVQTKEGCGAPHKQELKPPHCPQPGLSTAQPLSVRWAHNRRGVRECWHTGNSSSCTPACFSRETGKLSVSLRECNF